MTLISICLICGVILKIYTERRKRRNIEVEPPSVTKHIARTLERYPDGGQILKVSVVIVLAY